MATVLTTYPGADALPMAPSPVLSASTSRPRSSTLASAQFSSTTSQSPLHQRMSTALRRVSKDLDRSREKDATRSSGASKYVPPPPLEPLDPALAASRLAWSQPPRISEDQRYYESVAVRGSGYARYPTTKPTTLRVEENKVKGFRAVWRDFILNLRMKLYRWRKKVFKNT